MRSGRAAAIAVGLACACAGGPALAAVAGRAPRYGGGPTPTIPLTSTPDSTTTTTTTTTITSSTPTTPTLLVCVAAGRRTIARALKVRAATIHEHLFTGSNGMPQCNFVVARARRGGPPGKVVVTVNVDNGPQPVWRLMRKVVEAGQIFGPIPKGWKPPVGISGLGAYASWFPNLHQLMANNVTRKYLLTVGVIWRHATRAEMIAFVRRVITTYRRIAQLPA
jgi:hypothetical protein